MFTVVRILVILAITWQPGECSDNCPNGEWNEVHKACWRDSTEELSFIQAIHECISHDVKNGPGANLMPIGKLRYLKNRFDRDFKTHLRVDFEHSSGPYRVNAIKTSTGEWREYPSGNLVQFHHFPHFHAAHGEPGDTLLWDPHQDKLILASKRAQHHALCFRSPICNDCGRCPGFEYGRECNNAGDCRGGLCVCDSGFRGSTCQVQDRNDAALLIVGSLNATNNAWIFDLQNKSDCFTTSIPTAYTAFGFGAYFDDHPHYCDSERTNLCYKYEKKVNQWMMMASPKKLGSLGGAAVIPSRESRVKFPTAPGLNYGWPEKNNWWVTGGVKLDTSLTPIEYLATAELFSRGFWRDSIGSSDESEGDLLTPGATSIYSHCLVQINSCETALIGGSYNYITSLLPSSPNTNIYVYNWRDKAWRIEKRNIPPISISSCATLEDPSSGRKTVLISGISLNYTPILFTWDPVSGLVHFLDSTKEVVKLIQYTDNEVLYFALDFNGIKGIVGSITSDFNKTDIGRTFYNYFGEVFLIPKRSMACST